jgi:RND family efflux transporter MFP subunit
VTIGTVNPARRGTLAVVFLAGVLGAAACRGGAGAADAPAAAEAPRPTLDIGPENVVTVEAHEIRVGPVVSGALRPAREATVRAEVGGQVLRIGPEEGQSVRVGTLLAQIEALTLGDAVASSQSGVRSAEQALDVARREAQRAETLVKAGAIAERDVDLARNSVTAAQAQLDAARSRLVSARAAFGDATVRSPMNGIVSRRQVSSGDVVAPGSELYTIIDPSSMQMEGSVPSAEIGALRVGAPVVFEVRGYPGQTFEGRIERISPVADPVTRQVPIFVAIPNAGSRLVAGLFAEGRVTREVRQGLVVPDVAVNVAGARPWVLRIAGEATERVEVTLGLRDERTERVEIVEGVKAGDRLLVGAAQGIDPGTPVRVRSGQAGE